MPTPAGPSSAPAWTPTLEEVADYCTARTLVAQPSGSNLEVFAFSSVTRPTAQQVARLIEDAVGAILVRTGTLDATLYSQANTVAAIMAAGYVEMRTPERQSATRENAITTGEFLLKRADALLDQLVARNTVLTGVDADDEDAVFAVAPVWSFPCPPLDVTY